MMFQKLEKMTERPAPFEYYTAKELWTDDYTSEQMLAYHLNPSVDLASRRPEFINGSVEWITSRFEVAKGIRIADFGCGPGLYANALARTGAQVTGIDFSPRSINYAREKATEDGLDICYLNEDYLEVKINDQFDLIIMIFCDFCVLSPEQRYTLLQKFRRLLKPGGKILMDVSSLNAFSKRKEQVVYEPNLLGGFWSPNKYHGFLATFLYEEEKVALDKYTIVEPERIRTVYNWLQYYDMDSLGKEFDAAGLKIESHYGNVAGDSADAESDEMAVVASLK